MSFFCSLRLTIHQIDFSKYDRDLDDAYYNTIGEHERLQPDEFLCVFAHGRLPLDQIKQVQSASYEDEEVKEFISRKVGSRE
jgi:hypothetical protein